MEIKAPTIKLPATLPFEGAVDRALNSLAQKIEQSPSTQTLRKIHEKLPYLSEAKVGTPLGDIKLPSLEPPFLEPPRIDDRRREALKAAIGQDLSYFPGLIPVVGDIVADGMEDIFGAKIYETLTPEEFREFQSWDKKSPLSSIAMIQTFIRRGEVRR